MGTVLCRGCYTCSHLLCIEILIDALACRHYFFGWFVSFSLPLYRKNLFNGNRHDWRRRRRNSIHITKSKFSFKTEKSATKIMFVTKVKLSPFSVLYNTARCCPPLHAHRECLSVGIIH